MSLPTVSGTGFLISDGVTVSFAKNGNAWARLPLVFKNRKRNDDGSWTHDKEVLIEATAFGPLAEFLADNVSGRQDIAVTGDLYSEEYQAKDGSTKTALRMVLAAAAPVKSREKVGATTRPKQDDDVPF